MLSASIARPEEEDLPNAAPPDMVVAAAVLPVAVDAPPAPGANLPAQAAPSPQAAQPAPPQHNPLIHRRLTDLVFDKHIREMELAHGNYDEQFAYEVPPRHPYSRVNRCVSSQNTRDRGATVSPIDPETDSYTVTMTFVPRALIAFCQPATRKTLISSQIGQG
ncbi:MAG: hypothetical protein SGARI_000310 [Bacillariaceae sp.]